jgi:Tol biopolymer transport system component
VAFNSTTGDWDVWTYDVQRGGAARVPMEGQQSTPVWTPDGSRLAFSSSLRGTSDQFLDLLLIDPDGRSPAERLTTTRVTAGGTMNSGRWAGAWTPDGRTLAFTGPGGASRRAIWVVSRDGKTEPRRLLSDSTEPDFSADGRWRAYSSGSPLQVYVQPYPALDHRAQVSIDGGINPAWRRDGREMYYLQDASADGALKVRVMAVPVATAPTFSAGTPHMLFEGPFRRDGPFRNYDVTADGQRFLLVQEVQRPPARVSQMVLVQNWVEELKRLAPTK